MPSRLEVIVGPMFSAKSQILISKAERAALAKQRVLSVKPVTDTRTPGIAARRLLEDGSSVHAYHLPAHEIACEEDLDRLLGEHVYDVIIVDEAQFFPLDGSGDQLGWFGRFIKRLMYERRRDNLSIVIAGLDQTWDGMPFNGMPGLCALADRVEKVTAICECGSEAQHSQRLTADTAQVAIGDADMYKPRCRVCFVPDA